MASLRSIIDHAVLPPKVPGEKEENYDEISLELLKRLVHACETLRRLADLPFSNAFDSLHESLLACKDLNRGRLDRDSLLKHFSQLPPNNVLICYVVEQNAAVLIRRESNENNEEFVVIESFETSPSTEQVLAADNALTWDFPGRAVRLSATDFNDEKLQKSVFTFLERASMEIIHDMQAQTNKAKVSVGEVRDTSDPALVTQMLMGLLEAVGEFAHVPKMRKKIRDDVNFTTGLMPWRRLPFWLVLRVAMQRHLCLLLGESGKACYKALMCEFLSELLGDATKSLISINEVGTTHKSSRLEPDLIISLRTKLCRRMIKLEHERACLVANQQEFDTLFNDLTATITNSIESANQCVDALWNDFKKKTKRYVPHLAQKASEKSLQLSLMKSGSYLEKLLANHKSSTPSSNNVSLDLPNPLDKLVQEIHTFTNRIAQLTEMEQKFELDNSLKGDTPRDLQLRCLTLAEEIHKVFSTVGNTYDEDPILQSIKILTIFELWMRMDECALLLCPLLGDYIPVFRPELLDALQLPALKDMKRLLAIQTYLAKRRAKARHPHIFSNTDTHSFAVQYVKQSKEMMEHMEFINTSSNNDRIAKIRQWEKTKNTYEHLTLQIEKLSCLCTFEEGRRDVRGCTKCWHWRTRKKLTIQHHEDFLPKDEAKSHTIVFELGIPSYLSAYRDATWRILKDLAYPTKPSTYSPYTTLDRRLQGFMKVTRGRISLASAKKSFNETHYSFSSGIVPLEKILLPFAANFQLYDHEAETWVKDFFLKNFTLHHLCGIHVPHGLSTTILMPQLHPATDVDGPLSYKIQANITKCPSTMSVAEFSAYQKLLAGKSRRWLNILVELGSSNLNFSSEETTMVLSQLAVQAGPCVQSGSGDLRDVHSVFEEREFVQTLKKQIQSRMDSICNNWRETNCMELLINLSLRVFSLLPDNEVRNEFEQLLKSARTATLGWIAPSQEESRKTSNREDADRIATYGLKASLLCRRTFETYLGSQASLSAADLSTWIRASTALQRNQVMTVTNLSTKIKSLLIHDAKMVFHLADLVRAAIKDHPEVISEATGVDWLGITSKEAHSTQCWTFLQNPHSQWIRYVVPGDHARRRGTQVFHLHILEGHFIVNGKRGGNLPLAISNDPSVKALLGDRNLQVYSSVMFGMEYTLVYPVKYQRVHFGMRGSRAIIRTEGENGIFEFVPKEVFGLSDTWNFDLPTSLLDPCAHWLNLNTGTLEVRRLPSIWVRRPRDWMIDVYNRRATRGKYVNLVDPRSTEFRQIARVFEHFESPRKLTVFQSRSKEGKLSVELRHLDLEFHVNRSGSLFCKQLKANIDKDQDAGTWYGLASKIVLRDAADTSKRSIIIPNGKLSWASNHTGIHVSSFFEASDGYFRFDIDQTLGRLSSQPDPLLLYRKALCHAVTSFCLPDSLTGVTGTEEALRVLQSGAAQPWSPSSVPDLKELASLLPQRQYYPAEIKRLQRVKWDSCLTTTIQNDRFEAIIRNIETKANNLAEFSQGAKVQTRSVPEAASQLRLRAQARRLLYERATEDTVALSQKIEMYNPRDRELTSRGKRVYEIATMIFSGSLHTTMKRSLKDILHQWIHIGGFDKDHTLLAAEPLAIQMESPISGRWGSLVKLCREEKDKPSLMFQLCLPVFYSSNNMDIVLSLAAFCCIKELRELKHPEHAGYERFSHRGPPSDEMLEKIIFQSSLPCPETDSRHRKRKDELTKHKEECEKQGKVFAQNLLQQWPVLPTSISSYDTLLLPFIDVPSALDAIQPEWDRRKQNDELAAYIDRVEVIYRGHGRSLECRKEPEKWKRPSPMLSAFQHSDIIPSVSRDLVIRPGPELMRINSHFFSESTEAEAPSNESREVQKKLPCEFVELGRVLESFSKSKDALRRNYSSDLLRSLTALQSAGQSSHAASLQSPPGEEEITHFIEQLQQSVSTYKKAIQDAFWSGDARFTWLTLGDMLPCRTPIEILGLLQSRANHQFGAGMKEAIINYGCAIAEAQRLRRLRSAVLLGDQPAMVEELHNIGHENWDPVKEDADWLLLEIDSNILIRTDQVDVARAIIAPDSGQNSVLQMNMGRGKTSCIMPMAAAILANGDNVSRLIVPKSLVMQTANMMHSRLGGLVGREICHIPFSRQTPTTATILGLYEQLHRDIQKSKGLILTSHEYVLSFRLSGLQRLADDNKIREATTMINFQSWLNRHCRDILDECDFTLSPKTQLNYPSGSEKPYDGQQFRWLVAEGLLSMVSEYIPRLQAAFPGSMEILASSSWFPAVQFLRNDAEDELHRLLVDDISGGKAPFLHTECDIGEYTQAAIKQVVSGRKFDEWTFDKATGAFSNPESAAKKLLIVRGLVTRRILLLCLSKRWNVQYGLHPNRPPLAVPFAAKGVPSELSEYGHPDVAIVLTCLSFYSAGLSYEQFRQGLQSVLASEDAASEYEKWALESTLPPYLQYWNLINMDDETQIRTLWKLLCRTRVATNYYMNKFVFPPYARQFTIKLQASAWDIPQFSETEAAATARTTGFSGTNDNKYLLPMNIKQEDLPGLLQTNAEVLSYLLQSRNRKYSVLVDRNLRRLSEHDMLKKMHDNDIRILIDAGAYILETGNRELAQMWLQVDKQAQAAVYFRSDNRAWVVYRDSAKCDMPLLATRLANNLDNCLVYFDEAHTRGVDLKLPEEAHAALTLALKQTKDNTMQAAMRLRQLRTTQSVTFFAPPEVDMSIKDTCHNRLPINGKIESPHVIFWLLEQTCKANEDLQPLFQAQGHDFCKRANAVSQYPGFLTSEICKSKLLEILQQPEHQTLEKMYGDASSSSSLQKPEKMVSPRLQEFVNKLSRYNSPGVWQTNAFGEVEQERELEVQLETEREIQKPIHYHALDYPGLSPSILKYFQTGKIDATDEGIFLAFDYIGKTEIGQKHEIYETGSQLFISEEFSRTIDIFGRDQTVGDRFMRPVEWILWSPSTQTALVIIPEEAEDLIPKLRLARDEAKVHLIAYAAPITRSMVIFNQLRYYSLPPIPLDATFPTWLKVELGILAGRLYADYEEWKLAGDSIRGSRCGNVSPSFLLEWLGVRCRAHDVLQTPMGYICQGRPVTKIHPFFAQSTAVVAPLPVAFQAEDAVEDVENEDWEEDLSDEE
ncbi:hypothetical protein V8C35DRAFT_331665 [Trichoderma chlorosporum]